MKTILFILLSIIFITSCSENEVLDPAYTSKLNESEGTLTTSVVENLRKWNINKPSGLVKQGDRIYIGNPNDKSNVVSFDLKSGEQQQLFSRGRNTGQALYPNSLAKSGNQGITILDIHKGMLFNAPAGIATRVSTLESLQIPLPAGQQHLAAVQAGDRIIATGLYKEGRYLLFTPAQNQSEYFLDYPDHPNHPDIEEYTKSILYASSVLKVRPDNQAFVCGDMYSGLLEICRIGNGKIERVKQHIFSYPKVYIKEKINGQADVSYSKDNCFGFTDISVSEDRIYAIYSGKTYRNERKNFQKCQTLLVLDWEGNILHTYHIDTPLSNIQYETEENAIYAIGYTPEAALVKIAL